MHFADVQTLFNGGEEEGHSAAKATEVGVRS